MTLGVSLIAALIVIAWPQLNSKVSGEKGQVIEDANLPLVLLRIIVFLFWCASHSYSEFNAFRASNWLKSAKS